MYKTLKIIFILIILAVSQNGHTAKITSWTKIDQIIVHDWAGIVIYLEDQNSSEPEGCTYKNQILLEPNHYLFDTAYSSILSSFHSNKNIRFFC